MILNPEFTVFTCLSLDKNNNSGDKSQIMIILNQVEIKIFKLIKNCSPAHANDQRESTQKV